VKILQIAPRLPYPLTDGGAVGIFKATEATAKAGADITFVTYPEPNADITRAGVKRIGEFAKVHLVNKPLPPRYLTLAKTIFRGAYPIERRMMPEMFALLRSLVESEHFDLVHVDHAHMGKYALWLKKEYGLPFMLREHNFECLIYERFAAVQRDPLKKAVASIHGKRLRREELRFIREAEHVAPITEQDLELMRASAPDQEYTVIPAGVDVDYFRPSDEALVDPKLLLWVGGMGWDPNREAIDYFLREIWPALKQSDPAIRLELVGEGTDRLPSFPNGVTGHGRVTDIRPYLSQASALVVPLRVGGGMRLKILDFLAAGKAVISTSIGAEGNMAGSGEHLLLADNPEAFSRAIREVLSSPELRTGLGAAGRDLVENHYAWEKIGQAFLGLYQAVLERKTAPISAALEL
jgi:polysaccharide biosynthesis protein PslH